MPAPEDEKKRRAAAIRAAMVEVMNGPRLRLSATLSIPAALAADIFIDETAGTTAEDGSRSISAD